MESLLAFIFLNLFHFITCPYPPQGDEVLPGSVLLPATRRGRYLANIVRRQAVDGTGIKFNKDADRMNAEAKKKVDVLSDELLPYIIAEQERRTTLYKRIMTAIQNGEKGVTIAEIRNKPPLIIRKGIMYRCPANRAPKEPDGSGSLMCDDEIEPTQVMYDSCLSAEDKDLYVAEGKYFFCNRHRVEGPDLPRNGSTVIGCAPLERTSLNYTSGKCALEDTDDVVVHYRYYPDRTYKFVTELDPDREVCDHWNPCQIGYIFSLPSPDQAVIANELWRGYRPDEYERDEIIPQDSLEEYVHSSAQNYESSQRRVKIPDGYKFDKLWAKRLIDNYGWNPQNNRWNANAEVTDDGKFVTIKMKFPQEWSEFFYSTYFAVFTKNGRRSNVKTIKFLIISPATAHVMPKRVQVLSGSTNDSSLIPYKCPRCLIQGVMVRTIDSHVHNLENSRFKLKEVQDGKLNVEILLENLKPQEFGDFFLILQNADGAEERVKILSVDAPDKDGEVKLKRIIESLTVGSHFDKTTSFGCSDCELGDIICNGKSIIQAGHVAVVPISKMITFNFPVFDDSLAGVYLGYFKSNDRVLQKIVAVIENAGVKVTTGTVPPPHIGDQFEFEVPYTCDECTVTQVTVNGVPLESNHRRSAAGTVAFFVVQPSSIIIRITEYASVFEGVYQAVFQQGSDSITKTLLEIGTDTGGDSSGADDGEKPKEGDDAETKKDEDGDKKKDDDKKPDSSSEADGDGEATTLAAKPSKDGDENASTPTTPELKPIVQSVQPAGDLAETTTDFTCADCTLAKTTLNGGDVPATVTVSFADSKITFAITAFTNAMAGVYESTFKDKDGKEFKKVVAVIENGGVKVTKVEKASDAIGATEVVVVECEECPADGVQAMTVNGAEFKGFAFAEDTKPKYALTLTIAEGTSKPGDVYQATFKPTATATDPDFITKTVLQITAPAVRTSRGNAQHKSGVKPSDKLKKAKSHGK